MRGVLTVTNPNWLLEEDMDAYLARKAVSGSLLPKMRKRTPAHAWRKANEPKKPGHFTLGTLLHDAVLEPKSFRSKNAKGPPGPYNRNPGKALRTEMRKALGPNVEVHDPETWDLVMGLRKEVLKQPAYHLLFPGGVTERTTFVDDRDLIERGLEYLNDRWGSGCVWSEGLAFKMRMDHYTQRLGADINIKSCDNATEEEFGWACENFGHFLSGALRRWMLRVVGLPYEQTVFIACETEGDAAQEPYYVQFYEVTQSVLDEEEGELARLLEMFTQWWAAGKPSPFSKSILPLHLPEGAHFKLNKRVTNWQQSNLLAMD